MQLPLNILADGIPTGFIFAGIVFVMWLLGAVLNSKPKTDTLKQPSPEALQLAEIRRRMREEQNAQKPAVTPRVWQKQMKQQAAKQQQQRQQAAAQQPKRKKQQRPQSMPAAGIPAARAAVANIGQSLLVRAAPPPLPAASGEVAAIVSSVRRPRSETAKNVRLMLQRNGIAEGFVLGEILGKPRGLQEI